jgi:hypothetical protein
MPKDEIKSFEEPLFKYEQECNQDGKRKNARHYVIKTHRDKKRVAIFIRDENKLRRCEDKILRMRFNVSDLLLLNMKNKQEGISIFTTTLKRL